MSQLHPVEQLRERLSTDFTKAEMPVGVHAVEQFCADPQFFPGGSGLIDVDSWAQVKPGSAGRYETLPLAPTVGVVVIGNFQASWRSWQDIVYGRIGGLDATWRNLGPLLASIPPRQVFLTNAYIGFPEMDKDTGSFPKTPLFEARCRRLLTETVRLFRPRAVVCMGRPAAEMLASIAPEAAKAWLPWTTLGRLRDDGRRLAYGCSVGGNEFTAVVVSHPSRVITASDRQLDAELVQKAVQ